MKKRTTLDSKEMLRIGGEDMPRTVSNMFIVMLANTADAEMYEMTYRALNFVNMNRPSNSILTLVETNVHLQSESFYTEPYPVDRLLRKSPFNYNEALAFAVKDFKMLPTDIFCVLNNDIVVHRGAFVRLAAALQRWDVVSAWSDLTLVQKPFKGVEIEGYVCGRHFSGWAWMCRWGVISSIGFDRCFPPQLKFWYQDNRFVDTFKAAGFKHALIGTATVSHLESRSHRLLPNAAEATTGQQGVYESLRGQ